MTTAEGFVTRGVDGATAARSTTRVRTKGQVLADYLTTTDHKKIGTLYLVSSFGFFILAGAMAPVTVVGDTSYSVMIGASGTTLVATRKGQPVFAVVAGPEVVADLTTLVRFAQGVHPAGW